MSEPTACAAVRCHRDSSYCSRCDWLVGLDGLHVLAVDRDEEVGWSAPTFSTTLEQRFRRQGVQVAQLGVHEDSISGAPALYRHLGWTTVSRRTRWQPQDD